MTIDALAKHIQQANNMFVTQAQKQVNIAMTLRNWLIGYYLYYYEQKGNDRAAYGDKVLDNLAERLKKAGTKGMSATNLKLFRQFYFVYPGIASILPRQINSSDLQLLTISQTAPDQLPLPGFNSVEDSYINDLINRLSFSHFIELIKLENPAQRRFYEIHTLQSLWSTRDLRRAMDSLLFERTGLSGAGNLINPVDQVIGQPDPVGHLFRNPYLLEFLQLEEKPNYSESDLENAIVNHLQQFLLEMGRGFCLEARQKRITFDNTHYRIDLVFYHRILSCNILIDLKLGEFSHADAGQMNVYLNYYREHEMSTHDNPPIGIILCAGKNDSLVKYATAGLPHKVFVSKYLVNLPTEKELTAIINAEKRKLL